MGSGTRILWLFCISMVFFVHHIAAQDVETTPDPNENLLWCLQCTWTSQFYVPPEGNNTNSTSEPSCRIGDLDDSLLYGSDRDFPLYNPICDTSKTQYYLPVLTGPCYDNACRIIDAGTCVKWTVYSPTGVLNATRFCATSNKPYGCYIEEQADGFKKEVCNCNDQHYCNSSPKRQFAHRMLWTVIIIVLAFV